MVAFPKLKKLRVLCDLSSELTIILIIITIIRIY